MIVIALFGCVNWSFTLISVHLGMHWSMVTGIMGKDGKKSVTRTIFLRIVAIVIAGYGLYAFFIRKIESYKLLQSHFVVFDYDEPVFLFLLDYVAVIGAFIFVGHYLSQILKWIDRREK